MAAVLEQQKVSIGMGLPCGYESCGRFAGELYDLLAVPRYSLGASVLACPDTLEEWRALHRTARKRADRAQRRGYRFTEVDNSQHSDDIHAVNVSLARRQGRPMTAGYTTRRRQGKLTDAQTRCPRHRTHTYGVLAEETLVAYLTLHRSGDLAMVSMILGHGDHLAAEIMYLLFAGVVDAQAGRGGWFYYNRHDSGTDGLRFYKERLGFAEANLEWSLA